MIQFLLQHQFWAAAGIYWIFSAAVSALPEPDPKGRQGYLWLYRFLHTTAGNITTALGIPIPGIKTVLPLLIVPILFGASACAAHYAIHPGAINASDSAAYDTLRVAQAAIDEARTDYQNQQLPEDSKEALNALVKSYNVARESWLTYRGAITVNQPSDAYFQQLTKNLADLMNAIQALEVKK